MVAIFAAAIVIRDNFINEATLYAIEYFIIYIFCLIGAFIKDANMAHRYKTKIDFVDLALYPILCAFVVSAAYDIIKLKYDIAISVIAFLAIFAGIWSRELVALLTNNKVVLGIFKVIAKRAAGKFGKGLSDKEKNELYEALQSGIKDAIGESKPEDELSGKEEPVGEFEWIKVIEK